MMVMFMMTYMRLIKIEDGYAVYEYGRNKEELIGTVSVEISNKENCSFEFYEDSKIQSFCSSTAHTIGMIYRFIRENNFPDEYVFAC